MAELASIEDRGSFDPRITAEGTITYLITLDDGYGIIYRDSGGTTDYERTVMQKVGNVDLAPAAVAADVLPALTIKRALEYLSVYKPRIYIPAHHDADLSGTLHGMWRPTEPIFQALKDKDPKLVTISRQYREPVCLETRSTSRLKK